MIEDRLPTLCQAGTYCRKHPVKVTLIVLAGMLLVAILALGLLFWVGSKFRGMGDPPWLGS